MFTACQDVCPSVSHPWSCFASVLASFLANSFNLTATSLWHLNKRASLPLHLYQDPGAAAPASIGLDPGLIILPVIVPSGEHGTPVDQVSGVSSQTHGSCAGQGGLWEKTEATPGKEEWVLSRHTRLRVCTSYQVAQLILLHRHVWERRLMRTLGIGLIRVTESLSSQEILNRRK